MPRPRINRSEHKPIPVEKVPFHERNRHSGEYNFEDLIESNSMLREHVIQNEQGTATIDFSDPAAVKELNRSLLMHDYRLKSWDVPNGYLIPPIPGRADYIHYAADLMSGNYPKKTTDPIPTGTQIRCLDIGVGASCVYPIIGQKEYGWKFVGADIDSRALNAAQTIIDSNGLDRSIELRIQDDDQFKFKGVVAKGEFFDLSICNPPFHASQEEADKATKRKVQNLKGEPTKNVTSNFSGTQTELWCEGGEIKFVTDYIDESKLFGDQILWFTTLISKKENVHLALKRLENLDALNVQVIEINHGNKKSRLIGWSFKNRKGRKTWHRTRWEVA